MLDGTQSGCINHPAIEAVSRCKQCGKPVCGSCVVAGPTGQFCSESCLERNQAFIQRARQLEQNHRPPSDTGKWIRLLIKIIVFLAAIATLVLLAAFFNPPVVGGIARRLLLLVAPSFHF